MKHNIYPWLTLMLFLTCYSGFLQAQNVTSYSLQQLTDSALKNNHALTIKEWQIKEKLAKISEDEVKKYPSTTLNSNYQYNFILGEITIPAGTIGEVPLTPTVFLPNTDRSFKVGDHSNYNIGVSAYQPITQLKKIKTGLEIDKTDVTLTQKEKLKVSLQIKQAVERLYYGTLIVQKQLEEARAKLELANAKLSDVENSLLAGKTITLNRAGLQANIADEEQNMLKLSIQIQDYLGDLINVTGIQVTTIKLDEKEPDLQDVDVVNVYKNNAINSNIDLQIANINKSKALLGIKATKQSNLPDVGLIAGYAYQKGNPLIPSNNPFLGVNLRWNIQDVFSNKQIIKQREFQVKQAEENIANTKEQVDNNIDKAYRKISQIQDLIGVAKKAVAFRKEEMKLEEDKRAAGLNLKTDLLNTKALLAKAEADMYAAQLSYTLSVLDLKFLTGQ
ncbi:MAG: TolC family protein [Ferruginibacter sp.]